MDIASLLFAALALLLGVGLGRWRRPRPTHPELRAVPLAERNSPGAALALFDLDGLTGVNDQHDFDTGDRLLHAVGDVLRRGLPPGAALERLESGRLLIWAPDTDLDTAVGMAERLRSLASLVQVAGLDGTVARTLSVGVVATATDESRARSILRADMALANAKRAGGNQTGAVRAAAAPSIMPSQDVIADAIHTRALEYHVQPIARLSDRRAVGVESLLRWNRPDGVVLGPGGFIDTLNRLPEAGVDLLPGVAIDAAEHFVRRPKPIYTTFNVTGAILDGKDSPAGRWLTQILDKLPAEHLVLEIVETAVIVAPDRAHALIEELRARGVRIALDDFGTGLSNLERLCSYPVDILKVDRYFVAGLGTTGREEATLTAMVALAKGMNLDLIAEGIETEAQTQALIDLGVHYGQGYHLGRPAPAADWSARMNTPA
ncbi:GGDEF and EAL domain-containing protein [Jannaschia donghaensis]|uniref:Bacteriophytochrome cph2 n=1 Tax=Jannaschia donghaensis TaxID=420998 RepID=A0A0M6YKK6_9RHOB|nr:GGDEF and EAL domain-containing protein [Jannaschia donghaensis]CTQ49797.1 Bacteriophytochrome cph2 [Jannaschia donghaensis]